MENLLKEEDFIKKPVKPWKWFCWFYVITAIILIALYLFYFFATSYPAPSTVVTFVIFTLLPAITTLLMIFTNKNYEFIPPKTIVFSIFVMMLGYWICFTTLTLFFREDIFTEDGVLAIGLLLLLFIFLALICIAIILPIIKRKQKKNNIRFKF